VRFLIGILVACVACLSACKRDPDPKPAPAESRPAAEARAPFASGDPNAENPDRDSWVDLATIPFDPALVGGRVVQLRAVLAPSLNAVAAVSSDVGKMHKFLLGAPLLMESPDRGKDDFEVVPWAARSLPEVSPDHRSQVWTLRDDLTWEDGKPVTAADYAFTFRMIRTKDVLSGVAEPLRDVASVEAIDAHRFKVTWSKANYRAVQTIGLDFPLVPAHASPSDAASFNAMKTHLACGPYRVGTFEPTKIIELVLRDEYRVKPFPIRPHYVERFVWESAAHDPTPGFIRLQNGDAHIVLMNADKYATDAAQPAFRKTAWRTHYFMPSYSFVSWNLKDPADPSKAHPILGDVRVRKALSHLFPLEKVAATTYRGLARPVSGPVDFRSAGYDPAIAPFALDPPRAAALLKEAGFAPGEDGMLARGGAPLRLTLSRHGPGFAQLCQGFQEEARRVGVTVALDERPGLTDHDMPAGKFDAGLVFWQLDTIEPDVSPQWRSGPGGPDSVNYSRFADPETDRLLDAHAVSFDRGDRAALYKRLHRRLHEEVPATFLLANASTVGISKKLANVKVHDLGLRYHDFVLRDLWEKRRPK
jgi:peptide/nickel transport system substrate-binding protein